jgi:hypothetical protein
MSAVLAGQLAVAADAVREFGLTALQFNVRACEALSGGGPIGSSSDRTVPSLAL